MIGTSTKLVAFLALLTTAAACKKAAEPAPPAATPADAVGAKGPADLSPPPPPPPPSPSIDAAAAAEPAPAPDKPADSAGAPAARADVAAFQAALQPIWNLPAGKKRGKAACDANTELLEKARGIDRMSPPAGVDAARWKQAGLKLLDALQGMSGCDEENFADADEQFDRVNNWFEKLLEMAK